MSSTRLLRSRDKILGGVCGGLAKWLGWDVTIVRLAYVLISILSAAFPRHHCLYHPLDHHARRIS
jgi:phage shock protein C